ncbi:MAG: hypothetical protein PHC61_08345 [Chitinivibrionales bacterium]|nr:hypothetical protein [Chitinivibrionales bacterium]
MKTSRLLFFTILCICLTKDISYANESNAVSPTLDTVKTAQTKDFSSDKQISNVKKIDNKSSANSLYDESRLSTKRKLFLDRKRQMELQYSDSSKSVREEKIRMLKKEMLEDKW